MTRKLLHALSALVLISGLAASGVSEARPYYAPHGRVVVSAPPPARYEMMSPRPMAQRVWVQGHWDRVWGGGWMWRPGHYRIVEHTWVRGHWIQGRYGNWAWAPGHWC